jgi:hypothetical protein
MKTIRVIGTEEITFLPGIGIKQGERMTID